MVTPAAVGYAVLSRQVVVGLIEHGRFDHTSALLAADALRGFAFGLVPFCVYLYALWGFYALRDTKMPFVINCFENALNIAFAARCTPTSGSAGSRTRSRPCTPFRRSSPWQCSVPVSGVSTAPGSRRPR